MESSNRKSQVRILSILLLVIPILLIWYIRINNVDQYQKTEVKTVSFNEAVKRYGNTEPLSYDYEDKRNIVYNKHRTMIPLIFKRDTIVKKEWKTYMIKKK